MKVTPLLYRKNNLSAHQIDVCERGKTAYAELKGCELSFLQQNIFEATVQIRSNKKHADLSSIYSYLVRIEKLKELSVQYLQ